MWIFTIYIHPSVSTVIASCLLMEWWILSQKLQGPLLSNFPANIREIIIPDSWQHLIFLPPLLLIYL